MGAYVERCVQLHDDTGDNAGETPDIIAIQMGTNDFQYYKDTLGTADIDYAALIGSNGDGTDELIRSFNAELAKVVDHFGAHIVDIYGSAITMADFDTYIGDGRVHPNRMGMDAYAEAFKRTLIANTAWTPIPFPLTSAVLQRITATTRSWSAATALRWI